MLNFQIMRRLDEFFYLRGRKHSGDVSIEVAKSDIVMLGVARSDALSGYDHVLVALIRVKSSHSYTCMCIDPSNYRYVWSDFQKFDVEICAKKSTVAFLHNH